MLRVLERSNLSNTCPTRDVEAVVEYDPFSQEFQADPCPVYRWMRDEAPVFYSEKWNWWALSRFEDVRAAATDPQTFLSYEGIDIDDTAKDQSGPGRPGVLPRHRHPAPRQDPPDDPAAAAAQPHRGAGGRGPLCRPRPDRCLAAPRHRGPSPGTGLADAERSLLRPPRPAPRPR